MASANGMVSGVIQHITIFVPTLVLTLMIKFFVQITLSGKMFPAMCSWEHGMKEKDVPDLCNIVTGPHFQQIQITT